MTLHEYLAHVENACTLARRVDGLDPTLLSQYRHSIRPIPIKTCVLIESATNRLVPRQALRADWPAIWPELSPI